MSELDKSIRQLEALYKEATVLKIANLDFLRALSNYIYFIETDVFLQRLLLKMRADLVADSIGTIKGSASLTFDQKDALEEFRNDRQHDLLFIYDQVKKACTEFSIVKDVESEEKLTKTEIVVEEDTPLGKFKYKTSGSGLLAMIEPCYKKNLPVLHDKIMKCLEDIKKDGGIFSKYLDYDSSNGILYFQGKEICINGKKIPNNAHYLLTYLFSHDPFYQHFIDELNDESALLEEKGWKSYYDACTDIQKKVKAATGIDDFLDFSTGKGMYVRLNSEYSLDK